MAIPDCECIWGLPLNDKLDAIYCVYYQNAQSTVDLPTCECVKGMPLQDKVSAIFCALLQQGSGGQIDPNNIEGATAYGISLLQLPAPTASSLITSDGATAVVLAPSDSITQNIAFAQISDASVLLTSIQQQTGGGNPPGTPAILQVSDSSVAYLTPTQTGNYITNGFGVYDGALPSNFINGVASS